MSADLFATEQSGTIENDRAGVVAGVRTIRRMGMKNLATFLSFGLVLVMLCGVWMGCVPTEQPSAQDDKTQLFADLKAEDSFADGKPYHLYFLSNGDGTCALRHITTDPSNTQDFVIEIPDTSPAGDAVTSIDIAHGVTDSGTISDFPFALTVAMMETLCQAAQANGMPDLDYMRFTSYYRKISVAEMDDPALQKEWIDAYPITAYGDVYLFSASVTEGEREKVYGYLTKYCGWNEEQYRQSLDGILELAKQSDSLEEAELCLTVLRNATFDHVIGMSIPKTVASIDVSLWDDMENMQQVTVSAENPTLKMIDDCLIDTATGTLELCLAQDGKIPEDAGVTIIAAYAFALCELTPDTQSWAGIRHLYIPEGVSEIRTRAFDGIFDERDRIPLSIHLPVSLRVFGRNPDYPVYYYAGTWEAWESALTFVDMKKGDYIYLYPSDAHSYTKFEFPKQK